MRDIRTTFLLAGWLAAAVAPAQHSVVSQELDYARALSGLRSNSVSDIVLHGGAVWLGTGKGLSVSRDNGLSWQTITRDDGLGRGGVSAVAVNDTMIWVATVFDSLTRDAGSQPTGSGLAYSRDGGSTWTLLPQPGATPVQNVSFDIAFHSDNSVWITSWGGGIRRTFNFGQSWEIVPPDTLIFDPFANLNHRGFSVISAEGVLWVGTAGGINKSTDNGRTWANFRHQNQAQGISGNFVVGLLHHVYDGVEYLVAATRDAEDQEEFRGVSITEDGGLTWRTTLEGAFVQKVAARDSVFYAVSDIGLFKSIDLGYTWAKFPQIVDDARGISFLTENFFSAAVDAAFALWVGGPDGLARSIDDGRSWQIFRGNVRPGADGEPRTYAYPSPFSPLRHNRFGDGDGHIRIQYNTINDTEVTVRIYDFAMALVAEVTTGKSRPANGSFHELWNGRNQRNDPVANGVYFYSVELQGDGTYWGKFIVMD